MMLCNSIKDLSNISKSHDKFIYECKKDGLRAWLVYSKQNGIKIWNRDKKNITDLFPEFKGLTFPFDVIFDGELCEKNFTTLMSRIHLKDKFKIELMSKKSNVVFYAFDILFFNDEQISDYYLITRKRILEGIKSELTHDNFKILDYTFDLNIALKWAKNEEGIIIKDKNSKYEFNKRSDSWLKYKKRVEAVVRFNAYEVNPDNSLTLTNGFNRVKCNDLTAKSKIDAYGFLNAEVEGLEFTEKGHIRMPILKRLIL